MDDKTTPDASTTPAVSGPAVSRNPAENSRAVAAGVVLALLTVAVYAQVFRFGFSNYDDYYMISTNPAVQSGLTWRGLWWGLTTSYFEYWHPVTWWSHMLDCELFGMAAGFHHLTSLALHVANTLLLFGVLRRMTGGLFRSAIVAALFALHPLHVESVVWLAERKDVLCACFWLLSLWAYVKHVTDAGNAMASPVTNPASRFPFPVSGQYGLALLWFALALMSKPMAVTLPFTLLLLDYWPLRRVAVTAAGEVGRVGSFALGQSNEVGRGTPRAPGLAESQGGTPGVTRPTLTVWQLVREKIPFFVLTAISCGITYLDALAGDNILSSEKVPWLLRLANVPVSYARYIGKMFWPADLAVLYPMPDHWPGWFVGGSVAGLLLVSVWVWRRARSSPYLIVGWLWFLGTLLPTIGLVPVGFQSIADRYTYIPLIGVFIMVVWGAADLARRWPMPRLVLRLAAVIVVVGCALGSWRQLRHWQDDVTLWTHVIRATGDNARAEYNLGLALHKLGNVPEAAKHYREAVRVQPDHLDANINLGHTLALLQRPAEATNYLNRALTISPENPRAHQYMGFALSLLGDLAGTTNHYGQVLRLQPTNSTVLFWDARANADLGNYAKALEEFRMFQVLEPQNVVAYAELGKVHFAQGNFREAVAEFERALPFMPGDADLELKLGIALGHVGRLDDAVTHLTAAVQAAPDSAEAHFRLGMALGAQGNTAQALAHYRRAVDLKADAPELFNNLAWLLATSPDAALRNGADAVKFASRACAVTSNSVPVFLGTLAAAYAEAGQFDQAVATAQKARELALSQGQTGLAEKNRQLLEQFKAGRAYHEPARDR